MESAEWVERVERVERAGCDTCLRLCLKPRQYGRPLHTVFLTRTKPVVHLKLLLVSLRSLAFMNPASIYYNLHLDLHLYLDLDLHLDMTTTDSLSGSKQPFI